MGTEMRHEAERGENWHETAQLERRHERHKTFFFPSRRIEASVAFDFGSPNCTRLAYIGYSTIINGGRY